MDTLIADYDSREDSWWDLTEDARQRFTEWARAQGPEMNGQSVHRTEVHHNPSTGQLYLRVHEFALDDQGRKYFDASTDDAAMLPTKDWPITTLPPTPIPLPGHRLGYEFEVKLTGADPNGWALWERTGRMRMQCSCGTVSEWIGKDESLGRLPATCILLAGPTHLSTT